MAQLTISIGKQRKVKVSAVQHQKETQYLPVVTCGSVRPVLLSEYNVVDF